MPGLPASKSVCLERPRVPVPCVWARLRGHQGLPDLLRAGPRGSSRLVRRGVLLTDVFCSAVLRSTRWPDLPVSGRCANLLWSTRFDLVRYFARYQTGLR